MVDANGVTGSFHTMQNFAPFVRTRASTQDASRAGIRA